MKIAVLGATGPTGQQVVKHGLLAGHHIVALVRNPQKLDDFKTENLQVVEVDIFSSESMTSHMAGCDAVISCLGAPPTFFSSVTVVNDAMKAIVPAMREAEVQRLVALTAWCTVYDRSHPKWIEWLWKPMVIGRMVADLANMEKYVQSDECQDINYTIVRPPGLSNYASTGTKLAAEEGQFLSGVNLYIPREDVAKFMLGCLDAESPWQRKAVAIGIPK